MNNDKAIEFETTLYKVNKVLDRLKDAGLNITKYQMLIEDIVKECNDNIIYDTNKIFDSAENFVNSFLENAYIKGIKKLELVYNDLLKYEIYLKISSFCTILRNFIFTSNKDLTMITKMRENILEILDKLKKSSTLDYQVEGVLVEDIYNLVYLFIKEELKFLGDSPTLDLLKEDEIHKYNIDRQIVKELERINLNDQKYELVKNKKAEIDLRGIDTTYLDKDFILTIIKVNLSIEEYKNIVRNLVTKADKYCNELNTINNLMEKSYWKIDEENKKIAIAKKKIWKNIALFITSSSLSIGLIAGTISLSKMSSKETKYKVTTTIYDPKSGATSDFEYKNYKSNSLNLIEYGTYQNKTRYGFKREVTKYDLSKLEVLELADYFKLDLEALGIKGIVETEYKETLTLNDLYDEAYMILEKISTDENDYIEKTDKGIFVLCIVGFLLASFIIELLVEVCFVKINFNERANWGFYDSIVIIKEKIALIKESKKINYNNQRDIDNFKTEVKNLFQENKEVFKQIKQLIAIIENNPDLVGETEYLNNCLKLTRELEKEMNLR